MQPTPIHTSRLTAVLLAVAAVLLLAAGCSDEAGDDAEAGSTSSTTSEAATSTTASVVPTTVPEVVEVTTTTSTVAVREPHADQTPPLSLNGLELAGDSIWVASVADNMVFEVDRASGAILDRFPADGAGPDDIAIDADGAVYWTGFLSGEIGRIANGVSEVVNTIAPGVNPLGFTADNQLIVGLALIGDALYTVPTDGGAPVLIAEGIGDLNAFAIVDGRVVGPTGGIAGPGAVTAVDLETGEVEVLVDGLPSVTASVLTPEGDLLLLSGSSGTILTFDLDGDGPPDVIHELPAGFWDNLSFAADGTLYVSSFDGPEIVAIARDGTQTSIPIGTGE